MRGDRACDYGSRARRAAVTGLRVTLTFGEIRMPSSPQIKPQRLADPTAGRSEAERRERDWADLMRRSVQGDAAAYHQFLSAVAPHLRAMARRRCEQFGAPQSEAEDVTQEVLLAVHLKRGSWDPARPIGPWLSAIVRNKLIDSLRRRGRQVRVPIEDVIETLQSASDADAASDRLDVARLLGQLREPQQDIVRSLSLEGRACARPPIGWA